jgi:hypothetical protein
VLLEIRDINWQLSCIIIHLFFLLISPCIVNYSKKIRRRNILPGILICNESNSRIEWSDCHLYHSFKDRLQIDFIDTFIAVPRLSQNINSTIYAFLED